MTELGFSYEDVLIMPTPRRRSILRRIENASVYQGDDLESKEQVIDNLDRGNPQR